MDECEKKTLERIKENISCYPDFPKPGITFMDIFSVLSIPELHRALIDIIIKRVKTMDPRPDCVVGLDARGFLFGPLIALELNVPFMPIRKKGKLPGNVFTIKYQLEYGQDIMEIQTDYIKQSSNVLLVDDLLATGGTLRGACDLLKKAGLNVPHALVVLEIPALNGRDCIPKTTNLVSLIQF